MQRKRADSIRFFSYFCGVFTFRNIQNSFNTFYSRLSFQNTPIIQYINYKMEHNIFKIAMSRGLILGLLFSTNFLLTAARNPILTLLTWLIMIVILVATFNYCRSYRDQYLGGFISYWKAVGFITLAFMFGGVVSAIFKLIYTQLIDTNYLNFMFEEAMVQVETNRALLERFMPIDENYINQVEKQFSPAPFALQGIWINIIWGALTGLVMGFFIKKKRSIFDEEPSSKESQ